MVARTVKIMGSAYSTGTPVSITVDYNGTRVFTGNVPTTTVDVIPLAQPDSNPKWENELGVFETDTDTTGVIPVVVTVTGGKLFFGHFWMNYIGATSIKVQVDLNIPIDPNNPSTFRWESVPTDQHFGDPNTNNVDTDGVTNTRLNGESWIWRANVGNQLGDWAYPVSSGETFAFDFFVDPNKIVLTNN